jgi:hypothetical protein
LGKYKLNEQSTITHFDNQLFEIKDLLAVVGQTGDNYRTYTKHTIALAAE